MAKPFHPPAPASPAASLSEESSEPTLLRSIGRPSAGSGSQVVNIWSKQWRTTRVPNSADGIGPRPLR
eukprot:12893779-Prorocentrum_lima.AAC.1